MINTKWCIPLQPIQYSLNSFLRGESPVDWLGVDPPRHSPVHLQGKRKREISPPREKEYKNIFKRNKQRRRISDEEVAAGPHRPGNDGGGNKMLRDYPSRYSPHYVPQSHNCRVGQSSTASSPSPSVRSSENRQRTSVGDPRHASRPEVRRQPGGASPVREARHRSRASPSPPPPNRRHQQRRDSKSKKRPSSPPMSKYADRRRNLSGISRQPSPPLSDGWRRDTHKFSSSPPPPPGSRDQQRRLSGSSSTGSSAFREDVNVADLRHGLNERVRNRSGNKYSRRRYSPPSSVGSGPRRHRENSGRASHLSSHGSSRSSPGANSGLHSQSRRRTESGASNSSSRSRLNDRAFTSGSNSSPSRVYNDEKKRMRRGSDDDNLDEHRKSQRPQHRYRQRSRSLSRPRPSEGREPRSRPSHNRSHPKSESEKRVDESERLKVEKRSGYRDKHQQKKRDKRDRSGDRKRSKQKEIENEVWRELEKGASRRSRREEKSLTKISKDRLVLKLLLLFSLNLLRLCFCFFLYIIIF